MNPEQITAACLQLLPIAAGQPITRDSLPFIRRDILKGRREFTEEEYPESLHRQRLHSVAILEKWLAEDPDRGLPSAEHIAFSILLDIASRPDLLGASSFAQLAELCDANTLGVQGHIYQPDPFTIDRIHHARQLVDSFLAAANP